MNRPMQGSDNGNPRRTSRGLRTKEVIASTMLNDVPSQPCLRSEKPNSLPTDYKPTSQDVCCGRGKKNWNRGGNVNFREIIRSNVSQYIEAPTKKEKTKVVCSIVNELRNRGSMFLREDDSSGKWYDIGDAQAREKVGHSLRDHVTTLSRQKRRESRRTASRKKPPEQHSIAHSDSADQVEERRSSLVSSTIVDSFIKLPSLVASNTMHIGHRTQQPTREPQGQRAQRRFSDLSTEFNSFPEVCSRNEDSDVFAPLDEAELLQEDILE